MFSDFSFFSSSPFLFQKCSNFSFLKEYDSCFEIFFFISSKFPLPTASLPSFYILSLYLSYSNVFLKCHMVFEPCVIYEGEGHAGTVDWLGCFFGRNS